MRTFTHATTVIHEKILISWFLQYFLYFNFVKAIVIIEQEPHVMIKQSYLGSLRNNGSKLQYDEMYLQKPIKFDPGIEVYRSAHNSNSMIRSFYLYCAGKPNPLSKHNHFSERSKNREK